MPKNKLTIKSSIKAIFFVIFLFSSCICPAAEGKQIIVVFRYDDYRSCTDADLMVINEFRKRNLPCTFGVIPFFPNGGSHDSEAVAYLSVTKLKVLKDAIEGGVFRSSITWVYA